MEYRYLTYLKFPCVFIYCSILTACVTSSEVPRPRGVSLSRAPLYDPEKDFTCFDGSSTIPFSQVNDDYCDCTDGSDEPGTAACPNGSYHCTNAGHEPLNIPSYKVNDGVCDCCDASDEYANSNANCINNCKELGRSAREEAQKQAEVLKEGKKACFEMMRKSLLLKQEKKDKLAELGKNLLEAEKVRAEKEVLKNEAEELENSALEVYRAIEEAEKARQREAEAAREKEAAKENFKSLILIDSNGDGKVDISEMKTLQMFDKDRNGEVSDEEARYFLNDKDEVELDGLLDEAWDRLKPILLMDSGLFKPPVAEGDKGEEEDTEQMKEDQENVETGEGEEEHFDEQEHEDTEGEPEESDDDDEDDGEEVREDPPAEQEKKYDEATQKLIDLATEARKEFTDADKEVRHIQSEIKKIESYFQKDFGYDSEYAVLDGQCFDYEDYEYIYSLCPYDKAVQKPKSSSVETRLGLWAGWAGPMENRHTVMLFDRGQSCWNGPQRSTRVRLTCGSEHKVTAVSEPNRCEYLFDFTTPTACKHVEGDPYEDLHDEL